MAAQPDGRAAVIGRSPSRRDMSRRRVILPLNLGIAVVAITLLSSCTSGRQQSALQTPSVSNTPADAVLLKYRSVVDQGWDPVFRQGNIWAVHCAPLEDTIPRPVLCRSDTIQLQADVRAYLGLLGAISPKPELQDRDHDLKQALGDAPPQLDRLVVAVDSGDAPAQRGSKARVQTDLGNAWFAVNAIDCWPLGIRRNGAEAQTFSTCIPG